MSDFKVTHPFEGMGRNQKIAVIAGAAGIGGFMVYRHHKTTGSWNPWSSGSNTGTGAGIDPVTGLPSSQDSVVDPITNETYLAEAQQYGSVAAAEAAISAYGQTVNSGSGYPVSPASGAGTSQLSNLAAGAVAGSTYTDNASWTQAAIVGLSEIGYSSTDVANALGAYIDGQQLTPAQATIVRDAISEFGPAPIGTHSIVLAPVAQPVATPPPVVTPPVPVGDGNGGGTFGGGGNSGGGNNPPPSVTPPSVSVPASHSQAPAQPSAIDISGTTSNTISCHWTNVPGATSYRVHVTYQSQVVQNFGVSSYSTVIRGLTPDHTYGIHIAAVGPGGTSGEAATWAKTTR